MVCAIASLLPLLAAWNVSGQPDALPLAAAGRMFDVPAPLMWATALQETRHDITNTPVSVAGAQGRMQVMPSVWGHICGPLRGPKHYNANVACGAMVLRVYLERCSDDERCAAWHYVGGDSAYAREVASNALLYELKVRAATWPDSLAGKRWLAPFSS